jgi:hypothetical protein
MAVAQSRRRLLGRDLPQLVAPGPLLASAYRLIWHTTGRARRPAACDPGGAGRLRFTRRDEMPPLDRRDDLSFAFNV